MKLAAVSSSRTWLLLTLAAYGLAFVALIVAVDTGHASWLLSLVGAVPWGDKLGHVLLVGTLSMLLNGVLGMRPAPWRLQFMMLGSLLILIAMSLEEASQAFNSNRTCDAFDWLANVVGIFLGEMMLRRIAPALKSSGPRPLDRSSGPDGKWYPVMDSNHGPKD